MPATAKAVERRGSDAGLTVAAGAQLIAFQIVVPHVRDLWAGLIPPISGESHPDGGVRRNRKTVGPGGTRTSNQTVMSASSAFASTKSTPPHPASKNR